MIVFRPVEPDVDAALLHDWLTRPYAAFWDRLDSDLGEVRDEYARIAASPHERAVLGMRDDRPVVLAEIYDPAHSPLAPVFDLRAGDVGMHFLTAPPDGSRIPGFTREVITAVMAHCLADPAVQRVIVEPDVRNAKVHALNAAVGFRVLRDVDLPDKRARLSVCERAEFRAAMPA